MISDIDNNNNNNNNKNNTYNNINNKNFSNKNNISTTEELQLKFDRLNCNYGCNCKCSCNCKDYLDDRIESPIVSKTLYHSIGGRVRNGVSVKNHTNKIYPKSE